MPAQPKPAAARAVDAIISDLTDRRGLKREWHGIDPDIQKQIRDRWRKLVEHEIRACLSESTPVGEK